MKIQSVIAFGVAFFASTAAFAEFKDIGSASRLQRFGDLRRCEYRAVIRSENGETLRFLLDRSRSGTNSEVAHTMSAAEIDELEGAGAFRHLDLREIYGASENSRILAAALLVDDGNARYGWSGKAYIRTEVLDLKSGVLTTTQLPLQEDFVSLEQECSSSRYRAVMKRVGR